tara:strand:+ start:578 stop:793 length:216 start_codon:yes stop_codon:yes gene_type:complete
MPSGKPNTLRTIDCSAVAADELTCRFGLDLQTSARRLFSPKICKGCHSKASTFAAANPSSAPILSALCRNP